MSAREKAVAGESEITPELLFCGSVVDRNGAGVKAEAWNTTTQPVRLTVADATGQHSSIVFLSFAAAEQLARELRTCCEEKRAFEDRHNVNGFRR